MRGFLVETAENRIYKLSPKKTGGRAFLSGPVCPCWSSTLASQLNKLCFGDYLLGWLSVSRGIRATTLTNHACNLRDIHLIS
jgi:hypothetical protein